jgi:uncharacterized protein YndB with AHSA1/START domain
VLSMSAPGTPLPALKYVRRLRASPRKVFDAFVDPREIVHWWGPDAGPTLSAEVDLRVGGRFRVVFQTMDGVKHESLGEYLEIDPPHRLVMSWSFAEAPDMRSRVTVTVEPIDGGAQLTVVHEGLADAEWHGRVEEGWRGALEKLVRSVEHG